MGLRAKNLRQNIDQIILLSDVVVYRENTNKKICYNHFSDYNPIENLQLKIHSDKKVLKLPKCAYTHAHTEYLSEELLNDLKNNNKQTTST